MARNPDHLLKKAAVIFKNLYDKDLIDEDVFLKWFASPVISEAVKQKCEPLVHWLQNAEEEDD
jgi:translation initiation factor 5